MRRRTRMGAALGAALALLGMTGCEDFRSPTTPQGTVTTLVVSDVWQSSAQPEDVKARVTGLQQAIKELREETGTGWVGRQDDVTGYLADLYGGSRVGAPQQFMDDHGPALFGIDSTALEFEDADTATVPGMVSTRAGQRVGTVPVVDAELVFTSHAGTTSQTDRLINVRGRVFPELSVSTEPQIGRKEAGRLAEEASGGKVRNRSSLVVLPRGTGVLAWAVTIVSDAPVGEEDSVQSGTYYIDAVTGAVLGVRKDAVHAAALPLRRGGATGLEPDPNSVEVTGVDPAGKELTSHGVRVPEGVELVDTTTPAWDQGSRKGGIFTYDASDVTSPSQLPGRLIVSPDERIADPDAIAAHTYSRAVLDYYAEQGRNSWDGQGGTATSAVNYGPDDYCNAFFSSSLKMMVYGNPCVRNGQVWSTNSVYPDVAGHEMTHGVTDTSAGLIYAGQSGALNESFSDYIGNAIGNRVTGTDSVAYGEARCVGISTPNPLCNPNPDGSMSLRYLLNGFDYDDYLRVLNPGIRLVQLELADQDEGGVHLNSAIWNNALWGIRTQLAKIDNQSGNDSPLAQSFDRAVFATLTTRLSPTSGFLEARTAVEQVIIDLQLDPVVLRVAREVFDASKICPGCPTVTGLAGDAVATTPQAQLEPTVSGDLVTWVDMIGGEFVGSAASQAIGGTAPALGAEDTWDVTLAGDAVIALDGTEKVVRYAADGASSVVGRSQDGGIWLRNLAGSDAGAAWAESDTSLSFVDPAGTVSTTDVPGLAGDNVISVGTGGGTVAAGTNGGKVYAWRPGKPARQVGAVRGPVASVATYGDNVLAVHCPGSQGSVQICSVKLFTRDGESYTVSSKATPFGATMSEEYAVWPEMTGLSDAAVDPGYYPETDLFVLSLATGQVYNPVPASGQQGFPSLSGRRLVWQDAGLGGDDVATTLLPGGL